MVYWFRGLKFILCMKIYSFEKLNFWTQLRDLVKTIYTITRLYPEDEKYGLISQMRRAAISVSSNIAEGTSRISHKDQAHFSQIAYSSLMELLSQLILLFDLHYIDEKKYTEIRINIEKVSKQINALRKSQLNKFSTP